MYCYRRRGHNEGDEPALTQPVMYRVIEQTDSVRENYLEHLLLLGEVTVDEAAQIAESRRALLEQELALARSHEYDPRPEQPGGIWVGYAGERQEAADDPATGVSVTHLAALLESLTKLPDDFHPHPKIGRGLKLRLEMAQGKRDLDWSA